VKLVRVMNQARVKISGVLQHALATSVENRWEVVSSNSGHSQTSGSIYMKQEIAHQ
jgi:hypothetical protein